MLCGECYACRHGLVNLCDNRKSVGYWYNGGFTKYSVVKASGLHRLPDIVSFEEGALIEPLACAVHAVYGLTNIIPGDHVLVSGPGTIGLMSLQLAKAAGAITILTGRSTDKKRFDVARNLGADYILDSETDDIRKEVMKITGGIGVDVVLECSGNEHAVTEGLHVVRKRGAFTQIGLFGDQVTIDYEKVCYKEVSLIGSLGQVWGDWEKALQLVGMDAVTLKPIATTVLPVTEWEKAFDMFERKEGIKILLTPVDA
jgi:L-iditol 2-dehydrogenase